MVLGGSSEGLVQSQCAMANIPALQAHQRPAADELPELPGLLPAALGLLRPRRGKAQLGGQKQAADPEAHLHRARPARGDVQVPCLPQSPPLDTSLSITEGPLYRAGSSASVGAPAHSMSCGRPVACMYGHGLSVGLLQNTSCQGAGRSPACMASTAVRWGLVCAGGSSSSCRTR